MDVSEPEKLSAFTQAYGIAEVSHILTTHKHADHSGGNNSLAEKWPALKIFGGAVDNIPNCTNPLTDGDSFDIYGIKIKAMHTPCHTKGHILYYCETENGEEAKIEVTKEHENKYQHVKNINRCVFTGDTIFIGGCGRFFEGTADQMLSAFDRFGALPDDTKVFCGHEYTVKNLEFGLTAEPLNPHIKEHYQQFSELTSRGLFTVPSLVSQERLFNVFMRCREPSINQIVGTDDPVKCMQFLREFKNSGQAPKI